MANKKFGEPRLYMGVDKLLRDGLDNVEIRDCMKKRFPTHRVSLQQITSQRYELRRFDKNILTSLQARRRRKTQNQ
jgi:hypothetical protein